MTSSRIHHYRRRLQFAETDAAGVAHFSKLSTFVEEAEHDFFRHCGLDPFPPGEGWPRLALNMEFLAPCRFGDELLVSLSGFALGRATLRYDFSAHLLVEDAATTEIFRGSMKICHAVRTQSGVTPSLQAAEIPPATRQALGFSTIEVAEIPD
jgi:acyl-CoA thioester hydrolase